MSGTFTSLGAEAAARRGRRRLGFRRALGLGGRRCAVFQRQDRRALADLVADLGQDFLDDAFGGRGHVHRGLVGFQRQQRLLGLHGIARLHQDFDDRHVMEIADVGNFHFDLRQGFLPRAISFERQTLAGLGFSGSMPYFAIASATRLAGRSWSSASAFSAATATWKRSTSKNERRLAAVVGAPEAVGAEHLVARRNIGADAVADRLDVVRRGDHRALALAETLLDIRDALLRFRMQHVPAFDLEPLAAQFGEAGHAPDLAGDAEILGEQFRAGLDLAQDRAGAEQPHLQRRLRRRRRSSACACP